MLYLIIMKAVYGCIESDILWYDLYSNSLKWLGLVINQYDQWVADKIIDWKQCVIYWYVDDNKVSHVNPKVNTMIIEAIANILGI